MTKANVRKARLHLDKLRHLVSRKKTPLSGMREEDVIEEIRKTREEIWDKKLALRP